MVPASYRVARRRRETHDTWTLELEPRATRSSSRSPRASSRCSTRSARARCRSRSARLPHGPHDPRGRRGQRARSATLRRGDVRRRARAVRHRAGRSRRPRAPTSSCVAGGIGLAPLRPAIDHVLAHRERYGNVVVLYGGRSPEELLYTAELERWRGRFDVEVGVTVDRRHAGWRGRVGVVTDARRRARDFDPDQHGGDGLRARGDDALRGRRAAASAASRRSAIHVSLERNMKCAIGYCGHCQLGPDVRLPGRPGVPLGRASSRC